MSSSKGPKQALQKLLREKLHFEVMQRREDHLRRSKLQAFLDAHQNANQWAVCLAALVDAREHGVTPTTNMIEDAIQRCGAKGKLKEAKRLYTDFFKEIKRPRPLSVHVTYLEACAACGNFKEAKVQLDRLIRHDLRSLEKNPKHQSAVTDDVVTAYLRASLAAHLRGYTELQESAAVRKAAPPSKNGEANAIGSEAQEGSATPVWEVALRDLVRLRTGFTPPLFRARVELTPLLLESAAQLADVGGQWRWCLMLLQSAAREQALIPPEAYDAALRVCYRHGRHTEVVQLMETMIATKSPPDERSVRLAVVSAEEVEANAAQHRPLLASENGQTGAWALSLQLLESMRLNGLPLFQQSYESPLRACVAAEQWVAALEMLQVMRRDGRPVSSSLYRQVVAARMLGCQQYNQVEQLLRLPSLSTGDSASMPLYLSAMKWCLRHRDWPHLSLLSREMQRRDIPESYDKLRLMIEAAFHQQQFHAVLTRFARFHNITSFEQRRAAQDQTSRPYPSDFFLSEALLDMVLEAYERVKGSCTDPMVEVAHCAALERKQTLHQNGVAAVQGKTATPEWMFSRAARERNAVPSL